MSPYDALVVKHVHRKGANAHQKRWSRRGQERATCMALTVRFFLWTKLVCAALIVLRGNPVSRVLLQGVTPCHERVSFDSIHLCPGLAWILSQLNWRIPCFDQHLHLLMWCGRAVPLTMEDYGISTPSSTRLLTSPSGYLQIVHVHVSVLQK